MQWEFQSLFTAGVTSPHCLFDGWYTSCIQTITALLLCASVKESLICSLNNHLRRSLTVNVKGLEWYGSWSLCFQRTSWKVPSQNNYITLQQGPECTTMTRELCLQAENTLHTGDGEWGEGYDGERFPVDEQKVHGPFRQMGRNDKVRREKGTTTTKKTVPWNINGIYLLTSYDNQRPSSGTRGRDSLGLTDKLKVQTYTHETCTHKHGNTLMHVLVWIRSGQQLSRAHMKSYSHRAKACKILNMHTFNLHNVPLLEKYESNYVRFTWIMNLFTSSPALPCSLKSHCVLEIHNFAYLIFAAYFFATGGGYDKLEVYKCSDGVKAPAVTREMVIRFPSCMVSWRHKEFHMVIQMLHLNLLPISTLELIPSTELVTRLLSIWDRRQHKSYVLLETKSPLNIVFV